MNIETRVFDKRPCDPAIEWMATQPDLHTAYEVCHRGDWMWWSLRNSKGNMPPKEISVAYVNACAERAKEHAEFAAADAACYTAKFAEYAADAAEYAADAATYIAAYIVASGDVAELKWQADWIRQHIPNPF